jgi:hypothetical protein
MLMTYASSKDITHKQGRGRATAVIIGAEVGN